MKRFIIENNHHKKLSYAINIPFDVNLDFLLENKLQYSESCLYSLFAIIVHVGTGNEYGHYFCIVKNGDRWIKYDDETFFV